MDIESFISFLLANFSLIKHFIKIRLEKYFDYILDLLIKLKNFNLNKRTLTFYIKIFFSFVTLYHCIVLSVDYLGFEYRYNLIVEDNSEGFQWKPMNVCTESKVLFDTHKVIQYFDLSGLYLFRLNLYSKIYETLNNLGRFAYSENFQRQLKSKFFDRFLTRILNDINFFEMNSLIVNENELFECSAKLHFNSQSIAMEIENCFEYFRINTTVIANNTFGICYEFLQINSSIVLKQNDFIKIIIKFQKQKDFIIDFSHLTLILFRNSEHQFYQYFRWFYFINDEQSIESKSSLITSTRIGLSAELKISKTSIEMLSVPYMTYCEQIGCRHDFHKITIDNDIFDYNNDTVLVIENKKKKNLIYHAEPKSELVDFISDIG